MADRTDWVTAAGRTPDAADAILEHLQTTEVQRCGVYCVYRSSEKRRLRTSFVSALRVGAKSIPRINCTLLFLLGGNESLESIVYT